MNEVTDVGVGTDLLGIVWHYSIFRLIFINPLLPNLFTSVNFVRKFLEEEGVLVGELMLR